MRKQQFMSVFPYLEMTNTYSGTLKYKFILKNEGIGPALIESVKVQKAGGESYSDLAHYVDSQVAPEDSIWYHHTNLRKGHLIPAKENRVLVGLIEEEHLLTYGVPPNTLVGSQKTQRNHQF